MGSVPAISVLILGIVVPALAGYIEVCNLDVSRIILCQVRLRSTRSGRANVFRPVLCSPHMRGLFLSLLTKTLFNLDIAVFFFIYIRL